jgi:hypothetical protein
VSGWVGITDEPVHHGVSEDGGDGEGTDSEVLSLLSYTLKYISLVDVVILCQVGL